MTHRKSFLSRNFSQPIIRTVNNTKVKENNLHTLKRWFSFVDVNDEIIYNI